MPDTPFTAGATAAPAGAALAAWAAQADAFPPLARQRALDAVVDTLGCMIAGAPEPGAVKIRAVCAAWGAGPATVVGTHERLAAPWAALANGTAAHALDFDDNFDPAKAHISAVLVPALLALAETRGVCGAQVIDSYIVGVEIAARLGAAMNPPHRDSGWHATSTIGAVAAAGACARLMDLPEPAFADALNGATSFAGGTMAQFGTMMKPVHAGHAAAAGVMAASFAAAGIAAGAGAIDGRYGMIRMMNGQGTVQPAEELAIVRHGLKVKPYPTCASTHRSIDAVLRLRAEHGLNADTVARIDVYAPASHLANLMYTDPVDVRQARFSLEFCLAVALLRGRVGFPEVTHDMIQVPALRAILPRIHRHQLDGPETVFPTRVAITTTDQRTLEATVDAPKGRADNPLTPVELWEKFATCCTGHVSTDAQARIAAALKAFDSGAPVRALMNEVRS